MEWIIIIQEKYGKSKQFRWINGKMIIPVGYVSYEYPKYKRHEVNKYVRKYSDIENCISYDVMKYMVKNALSRYIVQKGKCAVTHNALSISDMVCVHIKPCKGERNDTYRNLIILSKAVSEVVRATNCYQPWGNTKFPVRSSSNPCRRLKQNMGNPGRKLRAPRSRQRIINLAAWYLWNTAFSKQ